ncbi:hypothetical protein BJ085DRAFT_35127 [Dimargaris cristalligena]|uniref:Uncharacterized protein n=1 Tax=Dimargaris cristalligena TaxID=215637 RepID=A0A4P9ZXZ4_9FUNG|nr:hypothetical protein BJ085DRAFT_35127 [Dimargaris cristalligena]|eukprot:RKP38537.1 hypothetical protein BJ085DRAFT_35127 [Dimargaris cristalligena]
MYDCSASSLTHSMPTMASSYPRINRKPAIRRPDHLRYRRDRLASDQDDTTSDSSDDVDGWASISRSLGQLQPPTLRQPEKYLLAELTAPEKKPWPRPTAAEGHPSSRRYARYGTSLILPLQSVASEASFTTCPPLSPFMWGPPTITATGSGGLTPLLSPTPQPHTDSTPMGFSDHLGSPRADTFEMAELRRNTFGLFT